MVAAQPFRGTSRLTRTNCGSVATKNAARHPSARHSIAFPWTAREGQFAGAVWVVLSAPALPCVPEVPADPSVAVPVSGAGVVEGWVVAG